MTGHDQQLARYDRIRTALVQACTAASVAIESLFGGTEIAVRKGDHGDYATRADLQSRDTIREALRREECFAHIPLLDEEDETSHQYVSGGTYVGQDPLDGTLLFKAGLDGWGITAVYVEHGEAKVGVIFQRRNQALRTRNDIIFDAVLGRGCRLNGESFQIPEKADDDAAMLYAMPASPSVDMPTFCRHMTALHEAKLLGISYTLGCAVANTVSVLFGHSGFYLNVTNAKVWDVAACGVILNEAGGSASCLDGKPLIWNRLSQPVLFARTERIAAKVLRALNQ